MYGKNNTFDDRVIAMCLYEIERAKEIGASSALLSIMRDDLDDDKKTIYELYNYTLPYYRKLIQNGQLLEELDPEYSKVE